MFVFPVFLNSKATLLAIMRIKISGRLPWVKNYQRPRKPSRKYAVKVLKENEVVVHVPHDISMYFTSTILCGRTVKCEITLRWGNRVISRFLFQKNLACSLNSQNWNHQVFYDLLFPLLSCNIDEKLPQGSGILDFCQPFKSYSSFKRTVRKIAPYIINTMR